MLLCRRIFLTRYQGPQFGVAGTRALTGVYGRPIIGTIIKPSVGMSPEHNRRASQDARRSRHRLHQRRRAAIRRPTLPLRRSASPPCSASSTDTPTRPASGRCTRPTSPAKSTRCSAVTTMLSSSGGTCVMVSMNTIGLPAMKALRDHCQVAIHGHRNGWGMYRPLSRHWHELYRLPEILAARRHRPHPRKWPAATNSANPMTPSSHPPAHVSHPCFRPPNPGCEIMPVFSSGPIRASGARNLQSTRHNGPDLRGRRRHHGPPQGPAAGVRSLQQAWEAAVADIPLTEYAKATPN